MFDLALRGVCGDASEQSEWMQRQRFRIVTRAEIISICRRSLARLDAAIEFWTSTCKRNGTIDQSDVDRVVARRDEIRRMLDADRFTDLQKQVIAEISYLNADAERRAEKAAESEAKRKGLGFFFEFVLALSEIVLNNKSERRTGLRS